MHQNCTERPTTPRLRSSAIPKGNSKKKQKQNQQYENYRDEDNDKNKCSFKHFPLRFNMVSFPKKMYEQPQDSTRQNTKRDQFLHSSITYKPKNSDCFLIRTEKRETALEPFPFQLICFISSEVSFHHLLPGLVRDSEGFRTCSPDSRTSAPPMDIQNAPPRAPRADIGLWRTATTRTAHGSGISVRLFGKQRYSGLHSRSS